MASFTDSADALAWTILIEQDVLPAGTRAADEYKRLAAEAFHKAEEALQRVDAAQRPRPRMALLIGRGESTPSRIYSAVDQCAQ